MPRLPLGRDLRDERKWEVQHVFGTGEEQGLGGAGADFLGIERADCSLCDGSGTAKLAAALAKLTRKTSQSPS